MQSQNFDLNQSNFSHYSQYDFNTNQQIQQSSHKSINNSILQSSFPKSILDNYQTNNKLYLKDLQTQKDNIQSQNIYGKQNNIPNKPQQNINQYKKITIHKSPFVNNYKSNLAVDDSFNTSKIVQLQQELINLRKQLSIKQSSWIKQKSNLFNKIQISNYQVAEMKQRNNNLIQINQTLTQALGQINKNSKSQQSDRIHQQMKRQLNEKIRKIKQIEEKINKIQKQKFQLAHNLKNQKQKINFLSKNLQEYQAILKESNQRKLQSDQKILLFIKNLDILKKKLNSLPIKDQYLNPLYTFINSIKQSNTINSKLSKTYNQEKYPPNDDQNACSETSSFFQNFEKQMFKPSKYSQNQQYLKLDSQYSRSDSQYYNPDKLNSNKYYKNLNDNSYQSQYQGNGDQKTNEEYSQYYPEQNTHFNNIYKFENHKKRNNDIYFQEAKRIDTQQNQFDCNYNDEDEDIQEEVYLCQICQRVYPHQQFVNHLKGCKQYQSLLKQKKQIQSKLVSIKQQQYDNRKQSMNSLNSSAIVLNKSRSGNNFGKAVNNISNLPERNDRKSGAQKQNNLPGKRGNKTEREAAHVQNPRLELSQLLNISNISTNMDRLSGRKDIKNKQQQNFKRGYINPSNYYTSNYQPYSNYDIKETKDVKEIKKNPEIRYQTNIVHKNQSKDTSFTRESQTQRQSNLGNHTQRQSNVGKQSMQQQIRKIVQALNQGGRLSNKHETKLKKQFNKSTSNSRNPSLTNRNNRQRSFLKKQNQFN